MYFLACHFPPYSSILGYELKKLVKIGNEIIKNETSNKYAVLDFSWHIKVLFWCFWFFSFTFFFLFLFIYLYSWCLGWEGGCGWRNWGMDLMTVVALFYGVKVKFELPLLNIVASFIWSQSMVPLLRNEFPCNYCWNCEMLLYQESFIEKTWDLFKCLCFSVAFSYMSDITYCIKLAFVRSYLSYLLCNHELLTVMLSGMGQRMVLHLLFASQMLQ